MLGTWVRVDRMTCSLSAVSSSTDKGPDINVSIGPYPLPNLYGLHAGCSTLYTVLMVTCVHRCRSRANIYQSRGNPCNKVIRVGTILSHHVIAPTPAAPPYCSSAVGAGIEGRSTGTAAGTEVTGETKPRSGNDPLRSRICRPRLHVPVIVLALRTHRR
ncbi:hypothetical protein GDO81_024543 [Engystomops pustulosus]|uniref:Uncharacterized protein n=1 Tax=Engystomops pustulosus TaxID=76066 RepID=A0AAV6YJU2_ENGPU|nr:hypothetical protein GDO81_024543 [Engystomops pustulosus]